MTDWFACIVGEENKKDVYEMKPLKRTNSTYAVNNNIAFAR